MRRVLFLLLLLVGAALAQPAIPACNHMSAVVNATAPVAAGATFTATVTGCAARPARCNCMVGVPTQNDLQYGATSTFTLADAGCTCTFVATRAAPADTLWFRACAVC